MSRMRSTVIFFVVIAGLVAMGCENTPQTVELEQNNDLALSITDEEVQTSRWDRVFTFEHMVEMPDGAELHIIEKFSVRSFFKRPRRAILMLTPTFVTNEIYDADISGDPSYNALEIMAKAGYFAFAVTYEGYGESSHPADGRDVTFEKTLAQMGYLIELIRWARALPKVDILGGSMGSGLAIALGGVDSPIPYSHVGKIVLTSLIYNDLSAFVKENFFTPELQAMLAALPYLETVPEMYPLVLSAAEPHVLGWAMATFPGVYATGPTLEGFDLPTSEAENGRVPALQIWGDADPMNDFDDVMMFQTEYGGDVDLVVVPGAAHSPLLEPTRDIVFDEVLAFLEIE